MTRFLETPAFVLTAARLASDEAAMKPGTLVGPYPDQRTHRSGRYGHRLSGDRHTAGSTGRQR